MDQEAAQTLHALAVAWGVVAGGAVGSFLNVVVARVPAGLSIVSPPSRCPRCLSPIAWHDNVPVLSWLLLRGRCRRCRAPISFRYPLVELLGALLGGWAVARHGAGAAALAEFAFAATLVALAFIDLDTWLLPFSLTLPLWAGGLVAGALGLTPAGTLARAATGGAIGFGAFLVVHLVGERLLRKEALGFGDVVLLGGLGAWLGPWAVIPVVLLSSLQGALIGAVLLVLGRGEPGPEAAAEAEDGAAEDRPPEPAEGAGEGADAEEAEEDGWIPPRHAIPYGPFLALAALEWLLLGPALARLAPPLGLFLGR